MDAQTAGGSGFDAALKALEDLEADVAQAREPVPAPAAIEPAASLGTIEPIELDFAAELPVASEASLEPVVPIAHAPKPAEIKVVAVEPQPVINAPAPAPAAVISPAASAPAVETLVSPPAPAASAKRSKLPAIAIGLGLLSSVVSAVGLVVVSRTVVAASLVVADARERAEQMKKVGALVQDLETIRSRQLALLQRQQAAVAVTPLTAGQLDQRLGELREGLLARDQSKAMLDLVHDGQSQLNDTLGSIGAKVSRIETKIDAKH